MQWLQHVPADPCPGLFYAVDDIGLQTEFIGKYLNDNTALAVIRSFENDATGFMQHDG